MLQRTHTANRTMKPERATLVTHRTTQVDGISVFYREAGDPASPKLLLLGGFPSSSHQFRNLIPTLADPFHVLSIDYPGFGNTDMPDDFEYTFDRLSEIVEGVLELSGSIPSGSITSTTAARSQPHRRPPPGLARVAGDPELERLRGRFHRCLGRHPQCALGRSQPRTEAPLLPFLELEGVYLVYTHGHRDPAPISPDNWNMDMHFLERPGARKVQLDLLYDYRTNVALYPQWQAFLRERRPKTLIVWGENDLFFTPEGGRAYLRDLPEAELHMLDSGTSPSRTRSTRSSCTSSASTTRSHAPLA